MLSFIEDNSWCYAATCVKCGVKTGSQAEGEEDVLDPVITLGIEHVLLIVKGPDLSASLSVCTWSVFREEEEGRLGLLSLDWSHALSWTITKQLRSEMIVILCYFHVVYQNCMCVNHKVQLGTDS